MKTRLIVAAVTIPLLFVVVVFLHPAVFTSLAAIMCAIAAYEFIKAACPKIKQIGRAHV